MITEELKLKFATIEKSLLEKEGILVLRSENKTYVLPPDIDTPKKLLLHFIQMNTANAILYDKSNCVTSYYKKTFEEQTKPGAYRSFGDLFLIVKNYFPDVTFLEVVTLLAELDRDLDIDYFFCYVIHKRVTSRGGYLPGGRLVNQHLRRRNEDEFGITEQELNTLLN